MKKKTQFNEAVRYSFAYIHANDTSSHLKRVLIIDFDPQNMGPEKVRYKVIGVEMKGMESSMKLVALGATQRRG